jgi:hypothetical protein
VQLKGAKDELWWLVLSWAPLKGATEALLWWSVLSWAQLEGATDELWWLVLS